MKIIMNKWGIWSGTACLVFCLCSGVSISYAIVSMPPSMPSAATEQATQKAFESSNQKISGIDQPSERIEVNMSAPLTQDAYDQKIAEYIAQVNQTKKILDDDQGATDLKASKQALCQRIQAYQKIYDLSVENIHLDQAGTMKYVAQMFLERQKTSLKSSGMSETEFCQS